MSLHDFLESLNTFLLVLRNLFTKEERRVQNRRAKCKCPCRPE